MAAKYTIGPRIKLDGENEFREAITKSNNVLRTLASELTLTKSSFDKNDKSTENLTAQNKILAKQIDEQKKKLIEMNAVLKMATKEYGETHETTQRWQRTLNATTANINELERELEANNKTIRDTEQGFDDAEKEVKKYGETITKAGDKSLKFGDIVKAHVISDAIVGGFRRLGKVIKETVGNSIELASDMIEVQNVVDVTYENNSDVVNRWAASLTKSHGLAELSAKEYVGTLGAMIKSMGLGETQAMTMSQTMVELASDMASFYNLPIEEAFNKIRSGLSGQTEPLKQLGINLSVANVEAFALANGVEKAYSAMTQDEQVLQRYNYLMNVTADAQGDFARNVDSYANQQRVLQLEVQNFQTNLGEKILPRLTESIGKMNNVITESGDDAAESLSKVVGIGINGGMWLLENYKPILTGVGAIAGGMLAFKVGGAIMTGMQAVNKAWTMYKTSTEGATFAQWAFNAAANANPYVLLGTAIAAVAVGLGTYALVSGKAETETSKANKAINEQNEALKTLNKEIDQNIKVRKEKYTQIEAESVQAQKLADRLFALSETTEQSNGKSAEMRTLVAEINNLLPELNLKINEQTGALNYQREALKENIATQKEYYKVKAAEESLTKIAKDQVDAEIALYNSEKNLLELEKRKAELLRDAELRKQNAGTWDMGVGIDNIEYGMGFRKEMADLNKQIRETTKAVDEGKTSLNELGGQWEATSNYLSDNSGALKNAEAIRGIGQAAIETSKALGVNLEAAATEYAQKQLDGIKEVKTAEDERYKSALENIKAEYGTYRTTQKTKIDLIRDEQSRKNTALSAMLSAAQNAAKAEGEAFSKAADEIIKSAETVHSKRIEMYANEYNAQLGLINGEMSEKVNAYQADIDALKEKTAEEERIAKEKSDAEKIISLENKLNSVTEWAAYYDAKKALEDEVARQAREKEIAERNNQIKNLEKQIEDEKKAATEKKTSVLETLQKRVDAEKVIIEQNSSFAMAQIEKERIAKEAAELAKYNATKKNIDDAETYLTDFGVRYQTKLKEDTKSFTKYLGENYETFKIQIANYEMALARSNAGLGLEVTNNTTTDIDYDKLGAAITKGFRSLNIQVKMDSQRVGKMLVGKVAQEMYAQ